MNDEAKKELDEIAHNQIIIKHFFEVARQVIDRLYYFHTTIKSLGELYKVKTLPSRISLLFKKFIYKMDVSVFVSLDENLDRMTQELESCDDKINDNHQAVILLNAIPS